MGYGRACAWTVALVMTVTSSAIRSEEAAAPPTGLSDNVTQGSLRVVRGSAVVDCPLKHTDVDAAITGFLARVTVVQTFRNPTREKIEAVYVFPLPHTAAVDEMTMVIGSRRIVGVIERRAEARRIYQSALGKGQTASLLEQERPNIFTQSVGNIAPGQEVRIEISYVHALDYDLGTYEFHFPMVVAPRYMPGAPVSARPPQTAELAGKVGKAPQAPTKAAPSGTGWSPDTDRVPDASRISPPVLKPQYRTGHDISLAAELDAGVPIQDLRVPSHQVSIGREGRAKAVIELSSGDSLPNKDFVLRYDVAGEKPELCVLTHSDPSSEGFFMLMLQPKLDPAARASLPRELFFLIDVSGSMRGGPTEEVRWTMTEILKRVRPADTLQIITFAGSANRLFEKPIPATAENLSKAREYAGSRSAGGGTEMLKGIRETLQGPLDPQKQRIVIMLTDGHIGNEREILAEVGLQSGESIRFWALGIGPSPNRHLIDGVAQQGGGMSAVLRLQEDPVPVVKRIMHRIHSPQMSNITIDWGGLMVAETYPFAIPELWADQPVVLVGKYLAPGNGTVTLRGECEGQGVSSSAMVDLPEAGPVHDVLPKMWARRRIADLYTCMYGEEVPHLIEEVTRVALKFRLMSPYTSFVAVDERERDEFREPARPPRRMVVPVPLPEGISFDWIFGPQGAGTGGRAATTGSDGKIEAAIAEIDPSLPNAEALKGNVYASHGDDQAAYALFQKNPKLFEEHVQHLTPECAQAISRQLLKERRPREAIKLCRLMQIYRLGTEGRGRPGSEPSSSAKTQLLIGDAYFADERYEIARDEYTTVLTMWPKTPEAVEAKLKVAEALMQQKIFGKAEEILEDLTQDKNPATSLRAQVALAQLYDDQGEVVKARSTLEAALGSATAETAPDLMKYRLTLAARERKYREAHDTLRLIGAYSGNGPRAYRHGDRIRLAIGHPRVSGRDQIQVLVKLAGGDREKVTLRRSQAGRGLWVGEIPMPRPQPAAQAGPRRIDKFMSCAPKKAKPRTRSIPVPYESVIRDHPQSKWAKFARGRLTAPVFDRIATEEELVGTKKTQAQAPTRRARAINSIGLSDEAASRRGTVAQEALELANEAIRDGDWTRAATMLRHAYLLSLAAQTFRPGLAGEVKRSAAVGLPEVEDRRAREHAKRHPWLGHQLDLTLQNESLADALKRISRDAGVKLSLLPGSEEDAMRHLLRRELKVAFLDLRGVTVAQALDWLLSPLRMTWRVDSKWRKKVAVGTERRMTGVSPWVYDVAGLLYPLEREVGDRPSEDAASMDQSIRQGVEDLLRAVRSVLPSGDELGLEPGSATLLGLSGLMVYAAPRAHGKVRRLLDGLGGPEGGLARIIGRDPGPELDASIQRLRRVVPSRMRAYAEGRKRAIEKAVQSRAVATLDGESWRLPAAAFAQETDPQALATCGSAWADLLLTEETGAAALLPAARFAYAVLLARSAFPDDQETRELARRVESSLSMLVKLARKSRDRTSAARTARAPRLAHVYAILAYRLAQRAGTDPDVEERDLGLGPVPVYAPPSVEEALLLAKALEGESMKGKVGRFVESVGDAPTYADDDTYILRALAARHCGGEVWRAFRLQKANLARVLKPSGTTMLLVERLASCGKALTKVPGSRAR